MAETTTEDQQSYEEMFADRFTSDDKEYQQYVDRPADPPPIIEDWRSRGGGNHRGRDRYQDRRGGRGWGGGGGGGGRGWGRDRDRRGDQGWGGDRGWRGDQRGQQNWHDRDRDRDRSRSRDRDRDRDRDRHSGHGSGNQPGHPSSNQGYNSHHQRPHYDRY